MTDKILYILVGCLLFMFLSELTESIYYYIKQRKRDGDKVNIDLNKFSDDDLIKMAFVDKQFGLPNENYFERIIKPQYNGKNVVVHKAHLEVFMFINSSARKYVIQTMVDLLGSVEYFVKDDILYCIGKIDSDEEKKIKEVMIWLGGFGTYHDHMVKYRVDGWKRIFNGDNYGRDVDK
jgi:hypothetical protein